MAGIGHADGDDLPVFDAALVLLSAILKVQTRNMGRKERTQYIKDLEDVLDDWAASASIIPIRERPNLPQRSDSLRRARLCLTRLKGSL